MYLYVSTSMYIMGKHLLENQSMAKLILATKTGPKCLLCAPRKAQNALLTGLNSFQWQLPKEK